MKAGPVAGLDVLQLAREFLAWHERQALLLAEASDGIEGALRRHAIAPGELGPRFVRQRAEVGAAATAPWSETFPAWAAERGLSGDQAHAVRVAVLRVRAFNASAEGAARAARRKRA